MIDSVIKNEIYLSAEYIRRKGLMQDSIALIGDVTILDAREIGGFFRQFHGVIHGQSETFRHTLYGFDNIFPGYDENRVGEILDGKGGFPHH